ncbi:F-box/FBD/LRR-repeat protein At1g13570-like [Solanum tuberosum]|uniref:F-box/FBD/LRR-repeat protein At1g13570-like n=1 Tax=Solanum tuberosum TaxID=4113 RepID=UPI0003D28BE6|nr:PREDICTED: F-box/FBD/LRR-repeat protein At1g13570-like [Solanum tuberosum]
MTEEVPSRRSCDRISNLPINAIDDILTRLPLRDAVRTSILSRKWRYAWAKVLKLTLDESLWKDLSTREVRVKLGRILLHLFSLRQGPIKECRIFIPKSKYFPEVDNLIFFLSRNGIEYLVLELPKGEKYKLPSSIFTSSKMRHLTLQYCVINLPTTFQAFGKLLRLQLFNVSISEKHLEKLISRCPLLENMELDISNPLNYIQVNAPNLKFFNFGSKIISICFKNTPLLAELSIMADNVNHGPVELIVGDDVNRDFVERGTCNLVEFFGSLPSIKNLRLENFIIKTLIAGIDEIPMKLPMPLLNLKKIYLFDICLSGVDDIRFLLCLIKSSPYLEEIVIINEAINNERGDDLTAFKVLEAEYDSGIKLNRLTKVRLIDINGTKAEMEFIKLLLATSPVLEKMMISPFYIGPESPQTLVEILMQANTFQRASPRASQEEVQIGPDIAQAGDLPPDQTGEVVAKLRESSRRLRPSVWP